MFRKDYDMSSEYTLEQEITLLEQDYGLLRENLAELHQEEKHTPHVAAKRLLLEKIKTLREETMELKGRLDELKTEKQGDTHSADFICNVPPLPPHLLTNNSFNEFKATLVTQMSQQDKFYRQKTPLLLNAPSGRGKSVLVSQLAYDASIRRTFKDGIIWVELGQNPDILGELVNIIKILGESHDSFFTVEEAINYLQSLAEESHCLLLLDDAWTVQNIMPFTQLSKSWQVVITTTNGLLLKQVRDFIPNVKGYRLAKYDESQSMHYFSHCLQQPLEAVADEAREVVHLCEFSPAAIHLFAGTLLNTSTSHWRAIFDDIQNVEVNNQLQHFEPTILMQALETNITNLGEQSDPYLTLTVFKNCMGIPFNAITTLWHYLYQYTPEQTRQLLERFALHGLLQLQGDTINGFTVNLQRFQKYYIDQVTDGDSFHEHLLRAYRRCCGTYGWSQGPNDRYFFENLCYHLVCTERKREAKSLLLDFDWLYKKVQLCSLHSIMNDFALLHVPELDSIKQALQNANRVLIEDKQQFAIEILKYLGRNTHPEIQLLLNQAREIAPD